MVLLGVFFSRYVRLKSSFPDKKYMSGEIETLFSREAIENYHGKI